MTIANGTVNGGSSKGSIGGIVASNSGTVQNCINSANVSCSSSMGSPGGIVGINRGSVQNCGYLQNDTVNKDIDAFGYDKASQEDNVYTFADASVVDNIVMTLSASIDTQSVYTGEETTITFSTSPALASSLSGVFDSTTGAVRDVSATSSNTSVASAVYDNDGTITVTGLSEGETAITVRATLHATDLSTLGGTPSYLDSGTGLTFTFTLAVHGDTETSAEESETTKTLGPGGCNAGIGALALLALIPLALRRKR